MFNDVDDNEMRNKMFTGILDLLLPLKKKIILKKMPKDSYLKVKRGKNTVTLNEAS